MITINLSEQQAAQIMRHISVMGIDGDFSEVVKQIYRQLAPASTMASEVAVWRHEAGYTQRMIEDWKRKNETAEDAGL
ncbi:hypothetical protein FULANO1_84 [Escherichia phage vB_EcoD_Fulano1]|uniref:Uncharacterized protein n=1 Tax=Escherichia phage vB_EcoD_Fulano1 TaxID=2902670 RepID=A0AC61TRC8_9CAUD|nr:hypothetical protein FULANO1_84 [Escherichia phage vB_EcoD_Fulano1]